MWLLGINIQTLINEIAMVHFAGKSQDEKQSIKKLRIQILYHTCRLFVLCMRADWLWAAVWDLVSPSQHIKANWSGLRTFSKSNLGSTLPPGERLVFCLSLPKQPNIQRPSHHKHSFLLPQLWVLPRLFPCVLCSSLSRALCNPWQELAPSFLAPSFDFDPLHLPPLKFKFNWLWHHVWLLRVTRQSGHGFSVCGVMLKLSPSLLFHIL